MELSRGTVARKRSNEPQQGRQSGWSVECDDRSRLRRQHQEELSQRLYSIILAVHAAENIVGDHPGLMSAILELIHTQSAASLEDVRRLRALG